jgi:hypothetical protein
MSRYIDADALKNLILNDMAKAEREGKDLNGYTDALFHLKTIPAADVVEVVRCKDCKHKNPICDKCLRDNLWHDVDDFCSRGERSEAQNG